MRYLLLIYKDETVYDQLPPEERGAIFKEATEYSEARRPEGSTRAASPWSRPAPPRPCG
jgi:hypothetical protein